jgi:translation initiation factor 2 beta subunit (eIF-2beta)/eIF-5
MITADDFQRIQELEVVSKKVHDIAKEIHDIAMNEEDITLHIAKSIQAELELDMP